MSAAYVEDAPYASVETMRSSNETAAHRTVGRGVGGGSGVVGRGVGATWQSFSCQAMVQSFLDAA